VVIERIVKKSALGEVFKIFDIIFNTWHTTMHMESPSGDSKIARVLEAQGTHRWIKGPYAETIMRVKLIQAGLGCYVEGYNPSTADEAEPQ